jgi:Na+/proline symporter
MLTVFVYAKLWRRSALDTDLGFYEIRYGGKEAAFLRGFRALYLGIFFNIMIMATVSLAAIKIGQVMFGLTPIVSLLCASVGVGIYATLGGLTGSIWADFFQYSIAMVGAIAAAVVVVKSEAFGVGGMHELITHPEVKDKISLLPFFENKTNIIMTIFVLPIAVQWWSVWYPGAEPGGGGYIAQRMLSAKNEKNAIGATLFFNFMHYAVRPWPWIIVALASLIVFPFDTADVREKATLALKEPAMIELVKQYDGNPAALTAEQTSRVRMLKAQSDGLGSLREAFPNVNDKFLKNDIAYPAMISKMPKGLLGLIVASLIAAYMSTIATHLNWGSSYFVNDFYKRFVNPDASEKKLVAIGRMSMVGLLVFSCLVALWMTSAKNSFDLLLQIGAGTGLIYILRWFWWRINAHSEISAMLVSFLVACFFQWGAPAIGLEAAMKNTGLLNFMDYSGWKLVLGILLTTIVWITVTLMTRPEKKEILRAFYRKVQPGGPGWKRVIAEAKSDGEEIVTEEGWDVPAGIICMMLGCVAVWGALFATGNILYGNILSGSIMAAVAIISVVALMKMVGKLRMN